MSGITAEKEIEMIPIPGVSALDIASNFERMANERYAKSEQRYSRNAGEMMAFAPLFISIRLIGNSYFMEVESCFYANPREDEEEE